MDTEKKKVVRYACDISKEICVQGLLSLSCLYAGCIFNGTPLTYLTGSVGQTVSSTGGLHGQKGENINCHLFETELQAVQRDDHAGTEEAGAAGWLDLDMGAGCLPVQGAASRSISAVDQI